MYQVNVSDDISICGLRDRRPRLCQPERGAGTRAIPWVAAVFTRQASALLHSPATWTAEGLLLRDIEGGVDAAADAPPPSQAGQDGRWQQDGR